MDSMMEREAFLDAQLWLRRLPTADALLSGAGLSSVLPPPPPPAQSDALDADAQPSSQPEPEPVASWCCFQLGTRYCFFRADADGQDATQLQIEMFLAEGPAPELEPEPAGAGGTARLVLRFDKTLAYEVDPARIRAVEVPREAEPPPQESGQRQPPPFGRLHFDTVSLRIWMDPGRLERDEATHRLQLALARIDMLRQGRGKRKRERRGAPPPSWKDVFRHSVEVSGPATTCPVSDLSRTSPARFLETTRAVLSTSGDVEAVKMVIDKVVRSRQQRIVGSDSESKGDDGPSSAAAAVESELFSDMEVVVLVTELAHLFGEDHAGVNQLLGFTHGDSSTLCDAHDRCYKCRDTAGVRSCATSKWAAWDAYLETAHQALLRSRKRKRVEGLGDERAPSSDEQPQAAADAFRRAVVEQDDYAQWSRRHRHARVQITAMERAACRALGLLPPHAETDVSAELESRAAQREEQRLLMVEQALAALLHKRRQLVRDELALELLPRRA